MKRRGIKRKGEKQLQGGTAYDGIPRDSKKIIRFENQSGITFNSVSTGTGRLYILRKAMVRLTVADDGTIKFTNSSSPRGRMNTI